MSLRSFIKSKFAKETSPAEAQDSASEEQTNEWDSLAELAQNPEADTNSPSYQRRLREKGLNSKGNSIFADERIVKMGMDDLNKYLAPEDRIPNWQEQFIFVSDEDFEELHASPVVEAGLINDKKINEETAIRAISNGVFFDKVQKLLNGEIPSVLQMTSREIKTYDGVTDVDTVSVTNSNIDSPAQLMRSLDKLQQDGKLEDLTETEAKRIQIIREATGPEAFRNYCEENPLTDKLDGKDVQLNGNDILSFFDQSDDDFLAALNEKGSVEGVSQAELAKFIEDHSDLFNDKFCLPDRAREHMSEYCRVINHDFINKVMETNEPLLEKTNISPELHSALTEGMPEDATNLDKALFTYIKLCKLLSYDGRYMAGYGEENLGAIHKDISYIEQITPENNRAVCYELTMILGKMLNEYGINFEVSYFDKSGHKLKDAEYGSGHANLRFRCDDMIVGADTVKEVYRSDLTAAKVGAPLSGLKLMTDNEETRARFEKSYQEMYDLISQQEKEAGNPEAEKQRRISEALNEYAESNGGFEQISLQEKKQTLLNILEQNGLKDLDVSVRLYQLFNSMFSKEYDMQQANISVVRRDIYDDEGENVIDVAVETVLSFNDTSFDANPENTEHFYVTNESEVYKAESEELQEVFNDEQLTIVSGMHLRPVPNINFPSSVNSRSA